MLLKTQPKYDDKNAHIKVKRTYQQPQCTQGEEKEMLAFLGLHSTHHLKKKRNINNKNYEMLKNLTAEWLYLDENERREREKTLIYRRRGKGKEIRDKFHLIRK